MAISSSLMHKGVQIMTEGVQMNNARYTTYLSAKRRMPEPVLLLMGGRAFRELNCYISWGLTAI